MYTEHQYNAELYHHGILGMHWGIRRYQNKDGSLTAAGKKRYDKMEAKANKYNEKMERKFGTHNVNPNKANEILKAHSAMKKAADNIIDPSDGSSTRVSSIRKRTVRTLSDENLNRSIARLRQEKEMKRLMDEVNHPARSAVRQSLGKAATRAIEDVGKDLAKSSLEYGIDSGLKVIGKIKIANKFSTYARESFNAKTNNGNKSTKEADSATAQTNEKEKEKDKK